MVWNNNRLIFFFLNFFFKCVKFIEYFEKFWEFKFSTIISNHVNQRNVSQLFCL